MNVSPYSRTRNRQLVRVLKLIGLLQRDWCSLQRLTRELSVCSRTVRRDLMALQYAGLPVRKLSADEDGHEEGVMALWTMKSS